MRDLRTPFGWRVFAALFALGSLSSLLAFPWPPPLIQLAAAVASVAVAVAAGVTLGPRCGLGAPLLQRLVQTGRLERADYRGAAQGFAAGAALGIGMLLLLGLVLAPDRPEPGARFAAEAAIAPWKRGLVAFDSAVVEEISGSSC